MERIKMLRDWSGWIIALTTIGVPSAVSGGAGWLISLIPQRPPDAILVLLLAGIFALTLAGTLAVLRQFWPRSTVTIAAPDSKGPEPPPHQVLDQTQTYFKGLVFRIADLALTSSLLKDKVFEDCTMFGPAVIALSGSNELLVETPMARPRPEDMLFAIHGPRNVVGPIIVTNCAFRRCRFINIGIMTSPEGVASLLKGFRLEAKTQDQIERAWP